VNLVIREDGGDDDNDINGGGRRAVLRDGKEAREMLANGLAYERRRGATDAMLDPKMAVPSFPRRVERVGKLEGVSRERASAPAHCLVREVRRWRRGGGRLSSLVVSAPVVSFEIMILSCKALAPISPTSTSTSRRDKCERLEASLRLDETRIGSCDIWREGEGSWFAEDVV
jgi:hypothetical protein